LVAFEFEKAFFAVVSQRETRRRMTEQQTTNAEVAARWIAHGMRQRDQKQWTEALESFEKALALDSRNPQAWALKGRALDEMNNLSEAIRCYKTSLDLNPNSASTWNNKGYAFRKQQKYNLALECYREAVRLQPNYAKAWYNMGYVLDKQGNYEDAIDAFQHAIELAPDNDKYVASKTAVEATWREFQKVFDNSSSSSTTTIRDANDTSPPLARAQTPNLNREIPAPSSQISSETISPIIGHADPVPAEFNPFLGFETNVSTDASPSVNSSVVTTVASNTSRPHSPLLLSVDGMPPPRDSVGMLQTSHENMMPITMQHTATGTARVSMDESLLHYAYIPITTTSPPLAPPNASQSGSSAINYLRLSSSSSNSSPNLTSLTLHSQSSSHTLPLPSYPFPVPSDRQSVASASATLQTGSSRQERHSSGERSSHSHPIHRTGAIAPGSEESSSSSGSSSGEGAPGTFIPPALVHSRSLSAASATARPSSRSSLSTNPPPNAIETRQPMERNSESIEKASFTSIMSQSDVSALLSAIQAPTGAMGSQNGASALPASSIVVSPDGSDGEHELVPVGLSRAKTYLEAIYTQLQNVKTVKDVAKLERALEEMLAAVRVKRSFLASKASSSDDKDDKCACCWERPPEMVCIPCGHLCICEECKYKLRQKKCPICSQPVKNIYKVFK